MNGSHKIDPLGISHYNGSMTAIRSGGGRELNLSLAADLRMNPPDFLNDHIWELTFQGGEPPALMLQTTYGLRARCMRIFPRFIRKDKTLSDPAQFHQPLKILKSYPNYASLACAPFSDLEVVVDYWVSCSQAVAGRVQLRNTGILKETFRLEWAVMLSPLAEGSGMLPVVQSKNCYLAGKTESLAPVFMAEGCSSVSEGSFPALVWELELYPGVSHAVNWACAALDTQEASLALAAKVQGERWDAQAARIELVNTHQLLEIQTGREDWNTVLAYSQTAAYGLLMPGSPHLPNATFVLSRQIDYGYSMLGDGSDYSPLWKGQTALDALYLASLILPGGVKYAQGIVENFLASQDEGGRIEWRPNWMGQPSRPMAQPVLAALSWLISQHLEDATGWLTQVYPALLRFLNAWFLPELDRDGDGFPEWENSLQTGLENVPLYDPWHAAGQGVDVSCLEAPGLAALLYHECDCLIKMARLVGTTFDLEALEARKASLRKQLEPAWDGRMGLFHYRDADSHQAGEGGGIKTLQGPGRQLVKKAFRTPQRVLLRLHLQGENSRAASVRLVGSGPAGEISEEIGPRRWNWTSQQARATSQNLFTTLSEIEVAGIFPRDRLVAERVGYRQEDLSLFLPLWANLCSPAQAKKMVEHAWKSRFLLPYGSPVVPPDQARLGSASLMGVSPLWMHFLGEGLLAAGRRKEAADLLSRTLNGIAAALKYQATLSEAYHAESGEPMGERNHLHGLAPLGLFLKVIGIQKITRAEVILTDFNPFPLPITVQYLGTRIATHPSFAVVTFSTGETIRVSGPGPHRISLD